MRNSANGLLFTGPWPAVDRLEVRDYVYNGEKQTNKAGKGAVDPTPSSLVLPRLRARSHFPRSDYDEYIGRINPPLEG
jgi:hypothetical protein